MTRVSTPKILETIEFGSLTMVIIELSGENLAYKNSSKDDAVDIDRILLKHIGLSSVYGAYMLEDSTTNSTNAVTNYHGGSGGSTTALRYRPDITLLLGNYGLTPHKGGAKTIEGTLANDDARINGNFPNIPIGTKLSHSNIGKGYAENTAELVVFNPYQLRVNRNSDNNITGDITYGDIDYGYSIKVGWNTSNFTHTTTTLKATLVLIGVRG